MKIVRCLIDDVPRFARLEGETVVPFRHAPFPEPERASLDAEVPLSEVVLLPPVAPSKIVAIGRNYADHAKELGNEVPQEPLIFLKPPSSIIGHGDAIVMPRASERVDFEGELAMIIGRPSKQVAASRWREHVLGFSCANDVTARDLQRKDVQFTRGKGFDTFCPVGPSIETDLDVSDLAITTRVNGEVRQQGRTSMLIFGFGQLIEFVSSIMTLLPGDVILTGTPAGVGPLEPNDEVEVEIDGIGTLLNPVVRD